MLCLNRSGGRQSHLNSEIKYVVMGASATCSLHLASCNERWLPMTGRPDAGARSAERTLREVNQVITYRSRC